MAGRRTNESMPSFVASKLVKRMAFSGLEIQGARVLILGATFKENCPDLRNSLVFNLVTELRDFGLEVVIHDPIASPQEVERIYGLHLNDTTQEGPYAAVILAVAHDQYTDCGPIDLKMLYGDAKTIFFDLKSVFDESDSDLRL